MTASIDIPHETASASVQSSVLMHRVTWGVRVLLAVAFTAAGLFKLVGDPMMVALFEQIGFGQWFRYLTGLIEVASAILFIVPAAGFFGGLLMTATMSGAVLTHLTLVGGSPLPAIVLLALSAFIAWRLKPESLPAFLR